MSQSVYIHPIQQKVTRAKTLRIDILHPVLLSVFHTLLQKRLPNLYIQAFYDWTAIVIVAAIITGSNVLIDDINILINKDLEIDYFPLAIISGNPSEQGRRLKSGTAPQL